MRVTVDDAVLAELQHIVALHRKHGAPNPFDDVESLVGFVLASVADGSRRPGAWERPMLDAMGLVADCPEHHRYRVDCGAPIEPERARPPSAPGSLPGPGTTADPDAETERDDPAALMLDVTELLSRTVAALHSVLSAFDTSEYRNAERWPCQAAALRTVYAALAKPWPPDAAG